MRPLPADWLENTLTRPVAAPARGWAAMGTWFEAATPHGPLRLYLGEPGGPAPHAAAAALALQRASGLLAGLDAWLGDDAPEWRWVADATSAGSAASAACASLGSTVVRLPWRDSTHQWIVPWAWLRAMPAPPAELAAGWQWPALEAVLAVARLRLSADELRQLEPGGAVLLPPSMRAGWTGRLRGRAEDADAGVPVSLQDPASPRLLPLRAPPLPGAAGAAGSADAPGDDPGARAGEGPGGGLAVWPGVGLGAGQGAAQAAGQGAGRPCEVRLQLPHAIPADRLAGWHEGALADVVAPAGAATLWQLAAGREPACCLAHGRLLPWGDGWALLIDGLGEEAAQAHAFAA